MHMYALSTLDLSTLSLQIESLGPNCWLRARAGMLRRDHSVPIASLATYKWIIFVLIRHRVMHGTIHSA